MNGYFSHVDAKKAIVFLPSLLQLFAICNVDLIPMSHGPSSPVLAI